MDFSPHEGFEWDSGNISKVQSRLDLATVEFAFQGAPFIALDEKHSVSEKRWVLVNQILDRFVFVIFTTRHKKIRVISARYMRKREIKHYEEWFKKA